MDNSDNDSNSSDREGSIASESCQSEVDSNVSSDESTEINDEEWNNYTITLKGLMKDTYEDVVQELTPDDNDDK